MIPKTIHYCWFGRGSKPKLAERCIASWRKYCPDYELIEWNEDNFDVNMNDYTKFTYSNRLYAYLSDYARLWAVEKYGGFYLDTDVELIRSLTSLQQNDAFFSFEGKLYVNTGLGFGAVAHHLTTRTMLEAYHKKTIEELQADYKNWGHLTGSPKMNTRTLLPLGLCQNGMRQKVCDAEILSSDFFCPLNDVTGVLSCTNNTIGIHWYMKSANGRLARIRSKISRPLHRLKRIVDNKKGEMLR